MRCPKCGSQEDRVVDSRASREGATIRRRRECAACTHRFTTYEEVERGERIRSVGFSYVGGREAFHGAFGTIKEQQDEIRANAERYGNEPPEYLGPSSKMRPYSELAAE